jgi:four helix bundle protein
VWQDAMVLVEEIYRITQRFPAHERYGLSFQLRRAAVSIPSNIGEGARRRRRNNRVFVHHLNIALGSQGEAEVQLEVALRLRYLTKADYEPIQARVEEIGRMLVGLIAKLDPDQ